MSPLSFGKVLNISGDGKAITIKVDENGNPIKNNQVATTKAMKDAIAKATTKQLIAQGGPEMTVSTSSSPYFSLDAQISLFELVNEKIDAKIARDGISFELDYGSVIQSKMRCVLKDYHNFSGDFSYGIDLKVPLPKRNGFSLGSIHLDTSCSLGIVISTSTSDIDFSVTGNFKFEGLSLSFGPDSVDIDISSIRDLLSAVEKYILDQAEHIFKDFIGDALHWANAVHKVVIEGVDNVAQGLKTAFKKSSAETASIMNSAGYGINETAKSIKAAYKASSSEIAYALSTGYDATEKGVAEALKYTGSSAKETAQALSDVFTKLKPKDIDYVLKQVEYPANDIKDAFKSIGGEFGKYAAKAWQKIGDKLNPTHWFT